MSTNNFELLLFNSTKYSISKTQKSLFFSITSELFSNIKRTSFTSFSLVIVGKYKMKKLTLEYKKKDKHSDVLSFKNDDLHFLNSCLKKEVKKNIGTIYISKDKVFSQAKKLNHSIKREFSFLFLHGLLHLLGYDHQTKEEEEIMFSLQRLILKNLSIKR